MRESDDLSGKRELWEAESDSDCLIELNLSRDRALIRKMQWEMFCTRDDSCCLKEENRRIVHNLLWVFK